MRLDFCTGTAISAISVDDFLATASTKESMDELYKIMKAKYDIKLFGRPKRFLGRYFRYSADGTFALSQRLLIDQTIADANMVHVNGNSSPCPKDESYHVSRKEDVKLPETQDKHRQLVGDLICLAD